MPVAMHCSDGTRHSVYVRTKAERGDGREPRVADDGGITGSYPFQESDPFVMTTCPHLYFVGCQPAFGTKLIDGPEGQRVRLISVPSFSETKELVLVDTETLEVTRVKMETVLERNGLPAGETSQSAAG